MAKDYAKSFYNSRRWRKCRKAYYIYRHGLCERCENTGDIVHHKRYITPNNINDESITLNFDNLELLCQTCHNTEHFAKYEVTRSDVEFDDEGNLVVR